MDQQSAMLMVGAGLIWLGAAKTLLEAAEGWLQDDTYKTLFKVLAAVSSVVIGLYVWRAA